MENWLKPRARLDRRLKVAGRSVAVRQGALRMGCRISSPAACEEGHLAYRSQSEPPPGREPLWEYRPMTLDESIQGMRLRVMKRADVIGVSAACRQAEISRTLFYRWRQRLERYGVDGVHPRRLRARTAA